MMNHFVKSMCTISIMLASLGAANAAERIANDRYDISVHNDGRIEVKDGAGPGHVFSSEFTVLFSIENPRKLLRRANIGGNEHEDILYSVPTWGREELIAIDPSEHVMDGFDPATDRELEEGRTANYYLAAPNVKVTAHQTSVSGNRITWTYPQHEWFTLTAVLTLPTASGRPELVFRLTPKQRGYYSVGYTGAPRHHPDEIDELWQPMIWQERRFPNLPYLTEAYLCPLPSALVTHQGVTMGVLADASAIPFMPIPKANNSTFGIMVRDNQGLAQPTLFAPVLGGLNSRMRPHEKFEFKVHLICDNANLLDTFEAVVREDYQFRDHRSNTTVSLNTTLENMLDYTMSPYSRFVPELRGCDYATDVPGAVKNITGLHPLSLAVITDNEDIYTQRARPMIEYGFSRERFLFATNPEINRDGTSARLEGPGVPMSDFAAVYSFSQNRMNNFLNQARTIYDTPINRSLNLTAQLYGDRWQNAMYLYKATGEEHYLEKAIEGADAYLNDRIYTPQRDYLDKHARGLFFWTSFVPQWMELYLLYEVTHEERFLDAAQRGARQYAQFVWFNPVIPDEKVTVNVGGKVPRYRSGDRYEDMHMPEETVAAWWVSEIGLTPESSPTCHGHRGIYLTQYAPWMLRIAQDADDDFLHDIARSAIVGRYESFPGYHMNAGRTTAHGKADFALRSHNELNGVTSMHYNHPWPHAATIMDYLVSDVYYKSDGQINFPSEYAEGYAYCRSKVYGARPGILYDGQPMQLYMPKGLATLSNIQINYLAARGDDTLVLMLTNQSKVLQETSIDLNMDLAGLSANKEYTVHAWENNKRIDDSTLSKGAITVSVPGSGLTVLAIRDAQIQPRFQGKLVDEASPSWEKDQQRLDFGGGSYALLFNFGADLQSVYAYTKANEDVFKKVTFHYANDEKWTAVKKEDYPFEFTVPLNRTDGKFKFYFEGITVDGNAIRSKEEVLQREDG